MDKFIITEIDGLTIYADGTYQHRLWGKDSYSEWKVENGVFMWKHPREDWTSNHEVGLLAAEYKERDDFIIKEIELYQAIHSMLTEQ